MTWDEYNRLFHKEQLNLVAFKRLIDCDEEVLRLVNSAIEMEREACAKEADKRLHDYTMLTSNPPQSGAAWSIASAIRARGQA